MNASSKFGSVPTWPLDELTRSERKALIIRADTVRGILKDRDPSGREFSRVGQIGSRRLASRFDPLASTAEHVGALLLGLDWADAKWLYGAGIPSELVSKIGELADDWLSEPTWDDRLLDSWAAQLQAVLRNTPTPTADELKKGLHELIAWVEAIAIVTRRPWLVVSWVRFPGEDGHLAVHDGAFGAALHFDHDDGPTLGGQSIETTRLDWQVLRDLGNAATQEDQSSIDWVKLWGSPTPEPMITDRNSVLLALRASLSGANLEANDGYLWKARPAALVDDADYSAYAFDEIFPTAVAAIERYSDVVAAEYHNAEELGGVAYWHEPMWVVHRGNLPVLLFDEAGQVHLPSSDWLAQAQGRAVLAAPGEATTDWPAMTFDVAQLLHRAERWADSWQSTPSAVLGDLLRAGGGSVCDYLMGEDGIQA